MGTRWKQASARAGRAALLSAVVLVLASGCWMQTFHVSDVGGGHSTSTSCQMFRPQASGEAFAKASGVVAPLNVVITAGVLSNVPGSSTNEAPVWSGGQGVLADLGPVTGGLTYTMFVGGYSYPVGQTHFDTDMGVVLQVKDAQGNEIPVDCVSS
jgi:hypothetical protein